MFLSGLVEDLAGLENGVGGLLGDVFCGLGLGAPVGRTVEVLRSLTLRSLLSLAFTRCLSLLELFDRSLGLFDDLEGLVGLEGVYLTFFFLCFSFLLRAYLPRVRESSARTSFASSLLLLLLLLDSLDILDKKLVIDLTYMIYEDLI